MYISGIRVRVEKPTTKQLEAASFKLKAIAESIRAATPVTIAQADQAGAYSQVAGWLEDMVFNANGKLK